MENAIESQLKTEHNISDEEIEAFYTSLKQPDKLKAFEEQNKEIVDNLFGFIDIEKFKAQMISIKRAQTKEQGETIGIARDDANYGTVMSWDQFYALHQEDLTSKDWKKKLETKEKDFAKTGLRVTIHQKKRPKKADYVRLACQMKNADSSKILPYFLNPKMEHQSLIKEWKVLERLPNGGQIIYMRLRLGIMSDRDNLFMVNQTKSPLGGDFIQAVTIERDDVPLVKKVVRMNQSMNAWARPNPNDPTLTDYTEIDTIDMGGYIPVSLLNMTIAAESLKEFKKMYETIKD